MDFIVHICPTLRQSSTDTTLSVSTTILNHCFELFYFIQASFQSKEKLGRGIYLKIPEVDRNFQHWKGLGTETGEVSLWYLWFR